MPKKPKQETAKPSNPALFHWKGEVYNLAEFVEFVYWQNHEHGVAQAKFLRANRSEVFVPVASITEAREVEAAVNPFWGRK